MGLEGRGSSCSGVLALHPQNSWSLREKTTGNAAAGETLLRLMLASLPCPDEPLLGKCPEGGVASQRLLVFQGPIPIPTLCPWEPRVSGTPISTTPSPASSPGVGVMSPPSGARSGDPGPAQNGGQRTLRTCRWDVTSRSVWPLAEGLDPQRSSPGLRDSVPTLAWLYTGLPFHAHPSRGRSLWARLAGR